MSILHGEFSLPGQDPSRQPRWLGGLITLIGVSLSLFQLYAAGIEPLGLFYQRSIHLALIMMLAFLIFPGRGPAQRRGLPAGILDTLLFAGAALSGFYLSWNLDAIFARAGFWNQTDIVVGAIATLTLLEASRRTVGFGMTVIGMVAIVYVLAGPRGALPGLGEWLPGVLGHRGYDIDRLIGQLYLGQEGIYGLPLGVAATYVFIFVLFGAFLEVTGAGHFFINLAYAATGRQRGGPAKAAVIASATMGSISGSAIANVVTTGAFTIPLMQRLGYRPAQAAGVEAAASTGGQIMPPLMGAGAFLIAEYTNLPYLEIVKVSVLPALMYFITVYLFVHLIAVKAGMRGMPASELPALGAVLRQGWHFLIPLAVLVYLLVQAVSPTRVGFIAIISIAIMAVLRGLVALIFAADPERPRRPGPALAWQAAKLAAVRLVQALEVGARNAVAVSIACAVAGIIVAAVGLTGLGLKFSSLMIAFSGGYVVPALALVLVASLVLGMGLPVTASYIVLVVLVGPALTEEFGIPLLIAHLVVFWYSQDSNVTPPIALAAFAGAAIAGCGPMRASVQAWKFAKGLYLIPLFMVFNPELITGGPWHLVAWNALIACLALAAFAAALEGYLFGPMGWPARALLVAGMIAVFWPGLAAEAAGVVLLGGVLAANLRGARRAANAGAH